MATKVKPKDTVWIVGTGKSKNLRKGVKYNVHTLVAAKLIRLGKATEAAAAPASKETKNKAAKTLLAD